MIFAQSKIICKQSWIKVPSANIYFTLVCSFVTSWIWRMQIVLRRRNVFFRFICPRTKKLSFSESQRSRFSHCWTELFSSALHTSSDIFPECRQQPPKAIGNDLTVIRSLKQPVSFWVYKILFHDHNFSFLRIMFNRNIQLTQRGLPDTVSPLWKAS